MTFGVSDIDRQLLVNNVVMLAKVAREYGVPVILTAVESSSFSGYIWPELMDVFPGLQPVERSSMNSWDDEEFKEATPGSRWITSPLLLYHSGVPDVNVRPKPGYTHGRSCWR